MNLISDLIFKFKFNSLIKSNEIKHIKSLISEYKWIDSRIEFKD